MHYLADRAGIRGLFSDADAYHLDQAFPLLMKQLELMLTSGELNPRHQHTVTLYAKGLTCKADTLSSCGYVYLAVYPTPECIDSLEVRKKPGGHWIIRDLAGLDLVGLASQ